jgi:hypothetical protein
MIVGLLAVAAPFAASPAQAVELDYGAQTTAKCWNRHGNGTRAVCNKDYYENQRGTFFACVVDWESKLEYACGRSNPKVFIA